jgi:ferredoxin
MADPTPPSTITQTIEEAFAVDPELCIACDACCQDFPEVFYMGDDEKAHPLDDQQAALYNARTVVEVCPTDAISFSGELPEAEDQAALEEVPGWEALWARSRNLEENRVERDRRYGRDFEVTHNDGFVRVLVNLPQILPPVRDRFKYGFDELMPEYAAHAYMKAGSLFVTAWVTDAKVRQLTGTTNSFPSQFTVDFDFEVDIQSMIFRHDAHGGVEVILFTDHETQANWQWKSHFITDKCTSCSICERVCPTNAITSGERYFIDPDLCINCSVCGVYCPFDAICDNEQVIVEKIKPKQVPKAEVIYELCTGCEFCVDVCPFDALVMRLDSDGFNRIAEVIPKACVSCKLCEQVCIKDAIIVPREHQFEDIGMSFMSYLSDEH